MAIPGAVFLLVTALLLTTEAVEWRKIERVPPNEEVVVTFAIKQENRDWLEKRLRAVSYPNSPDYGNYMNFDEIAKHVHGRPESVEAVKKTLVSVGASRSKVNFTIGMGFAVAALPVSSVETLFSSRMFRFRHEKKNTTIVRSLDFTMPPSIASHVDFVSGITGFPRNLISSKLCQRSSSTVGVTPDSIERDYNVSGYTSSSPDNSQAIAGFLGQYFDPSDLKDFQKQFNIPDKPVAKVVGTNNPDDPGMEASLDVQYISALGRNVDTWFVSVSKYANGHQEDFLSWMVNQVNTTDSPWVHSISYGDLESSIDSNYIQRAEDEFAKFGISGRTLLFASGDSGTDCEFIVGKFRPMWPSSSPHVTVVGGTTSLTAVWSDGGGGFSNVFSTPDYQKQVVQNYLNTAGRIPSKSYFNPSGRAYPDVSAFAVNFEIVVMGIPLPVAGTSCAAPTTAGIISLLNDVRLKNGKKTLGFLNPLLYQTLQGAGFFDITQGSNHGKLTCKGFPATKGWDAASGWGSPNFGVLKNLV